MNIKPIETVYNGYRFRSRLEARWAVFFDAAGIEYYYEPEGVRLSDGTLYLPDFYLPKSHQWFEVKGVMGEDDRHKIEQFIRDANVSVAVGYPDMTFQACDKWWDGEYQLADKDSSVLVRCRECGGLWFMGNEGSYVCQCCGEYDGDGHLAESIDGNGNDKWYGSSSVLESARLKAKQARFEHGESPGRPLFVNNQHRIQSIQPRYEPPMFDSSEEEVISCLIQNDVDARDLISIKPKDFNSPVLGRIYDILRRRICCGISVRIGALESFLDADEINILAQIIDRCPCNNTNDPLEKFKQKKKLEEADIDNDTLMQVLAMQRQKQKPENVRLFNWEDAL